MTRPDESPDDFSPFEHWNFKHFRGQVDSNREDACEQAWDASATFHEKKWASQMAQMKRELDQARAALAAAPAVPSPDVIDVRQVQIRLAGRGVLATDDLVANILECVNDYYGIDPSAVPSGQPDNDHMVKMVTGMVSDAIRSSKLGARPGQLTPTEVATRIVKFMLRELRAATGKGVSEEACQQWLERRAEAWMKGTLSLDELEGYLEGDRSKAGAAQFDSLVRFLGIKDALDRAADVPSGADMEARAEDVRRATE